MKNHGDDRTKHQWCQAGKAASKSGEENEVFEKNAESGFCCLFASCYVKAKKYRTLFDPAEKSGNVLLRMCSH